MRSISFPALLVLSATASAQIVVSPTSLSVFEDGDPAAFAVYLASDPMGSETISISGGDATEFSLDDTSLTFNSMNFSDPQFVVVTPEIPDGVNDGDVQTTLDLTGTTVSPETMAVTVNNIDGVSSVRWSLDNNGIVDESGSPSVTITFSGTQPSSDPVTFNLSTTSTDIMLSKTAVSFTGSGTDTVTITGIADLTPEGIEAFQITADSTVSMDLSYSGLTVSPIDGLINDTSTPVDLMQFSVD